MIVNKVSSTTVKTYTVDIEDGEVRDQPYSRSSRKYRVDRVTVVKRDGNVSSVELHGPVLKKDGADGMNYARERLYGQKDWPAWLNGVVGGLA